MTDFNKKANLSWFILAMYAHGQITDDEHDRLIEMIFSSDPENLIVAEELMKQFIKRNGGISWEKELLQLQGTI